jgi:hypothetical protein
MCDSAGSAQEHKDRKLALSLALLMRNFRERRLAELRSPHSPGPEGLTHEGP